MTPSRDSKEAAESSGAQEGTGSAKHLTSPLTLGVEESGASRTKGQQRHRQNTRKGFSWGGTGYRGGSGAGMPAAWDRTRGSVQMKSLWADSHKHAASKSRTGKILFFKSSFLVSLKDDFYLRLKMELNDA